MKPRVPRLLRSARISAVMLALPLVFAGKARADVWTTYAYPNDQRDMVVVGSSLWIASSGGALRYDTTSGVFTHFTRRASGGPSSQDLNSVCFYQPEGLLFFGAADLGVTTLSLADLRWLRFEELPSLEINRVVCSGTNVFIATESGFAIRRTARSTDICNEVDRSCCGTSVVCEFPSFQVRDFMTVGSHLWAATNSGPAEHDTLGLQIQGYSWEDRTAGAPVLDARSLGQLDGVVFLATTLARGVYRWDSGSSTWLLASDGLPDTPLGSRVRLFTLRGESDQEELWLATNLGLYRWSGDAWASQGLSDIAVRAVVSMPTATGRVLYAATSRGLYRNEEGSTWTHLPAPGLPAAGAAQSIDVDRNGVVWIGFLNEAVSLMTDGEWTVYRMGQNGLDGSEIFTLFTDSQNRVWLGKCCCNSPPACPVQFLDDGLASEPLTAWDGWGLAEDSAGRLWIGSNSTGIHVLDPEGDRIVNIAPSDGLRSASVKALATQGNRIFIGHEQRGLQILNTGGDPANKSGYTWLTFGSGDLPDQAVADIALQGSTAWVLTSGFLNRVENNEVTGNQRLDHDGEPRRGTAVEVDAGGNKWVGTSGGVLRIDRSGNVQVYDTSNSDLISNEVLDVAIDPTTGDVLFVTRIGTSRLSPGATSGSDEDVFFVYPNPWQPSGGSIKVSGGSADNARVTDLLGRHIATFTVGLGWDGIGADGLLVAPGIYLITIGERSEKLAVIR
jgi:hypothetical protein